MLSLTLAGGCAEGPLWKAGHYLPWVQAQWKADEAIAETVHARKSKLRALARSAGGLSAAEKENAAENLAKMIENEKIIQLRVDAAYALGEFETEKADQILKSMLEDPEAEVRIAALNAISLRQTPTAGQELLRVLRSDTDKDVRASAIRNLGNFPGTATEDALAQVLNEPEPALQYVSMKSLQKVTNANIGLNVSQWKQFFANRLQTQSGSTNDIFAGQLNPPN